MGESNTTDQLQKLDWGGFFSSLGPFSSVHLNNEACFLKKLGFQYIQYYYWERHEFCAQFLSLSLYIAIGTILVTLHVNTKTQSLL